MADNDLFRRSLDAGVAFTQLTRKRAETIVRDLVKNGELNREQATSALEELLERSRQNSEAIIAIVRKEIDDRIAALNLVTREDLTSLASRLGLSGLGGRAAPARRATATRKTTAKRASTAKKAPAKRAGTAKKAATAKKASTGAAAPARSSAKKATKSVKKA